VRLELTRRYRFAASHRLARPDWSAERNAAVYGKCANPHGHGHNYQLEVTVAGPVDPATGMIADLADLDGFVARQVLEPMDHTFLNEQVAAFRTTVPTTENLSAEIWRRLRGFSAARLVRIRIEETGRNSFEYAGGEPTGSPS
jgi:6-pyruvoyltetrahydropterin/6-carboxytetrahydropterin synthase